MGRNSNIMSCTQDFRQKVKSGPTSLPTPLKSLWQEEEPQLVRPLYTYCSTHTLPSVRRAVPTSPTRVTSSLSTGTMFEPSLYHPAFGTVPYPLQELSKCLFNCKSHYYVLAARIYNYSARRSTSTIACITCVYF